MPSRRKLAMPVESKMCINEIAQQEVPVEGGGGGDTADGRGLCILYLTRHGESEYNVTDKIGGNSPLTNKGQLYAKALGNHVNSLGKQIEIELHDVF